MPKKDEILFDNEFKKLLAEKDFLAYIMKYCVKEYEHEDLKTIMEEYIEPHIRIGSESVHHRIVGSRNENNEDEERVTFDIVFEASLPKEKNKIGLRINVEVQSNEPSYSLVNRGHYYNARQLSAQKGSFFIKSRYDDLIKVVSIWIVIQPPKYKSGSIVRYYMTEEVIVGKSYEKEKNYNKQEIIMVYLSQEESKHKLIGLLKLAANGEMEAKEKLKKLKNEYGIEISESIEKEVNTMCNVSELIKENGRKEGREESLLLSICSLMENLKIGMPEAMRLLNIPESEYPIFQEMMK